MVELSGAIGKVSMVLEIKRAATGEVETVEIEGLAYLSSGEPDETPIEQPSEE
jgi:hypothetical protein